MDFRIDVGFIEHPKTLRLLRKLGDKGLTALLTLWTWCTKYYPDGNLPDLNGDDINAGARWNGEADFAEVLVEIGFIDKDENGGYHLHDWKTHNPYAAEGGERAEKARFSKLAQVVPSAYRELSAAGIDRITQDEYQRIVSETKNKQQRSVSKTLAVAERTQSERRASAERNASETLAPSPDPSPTPKPGRFSEEGEISDPRKTTTTARARAKDDDEAGKPPPDDPSPDKMSLSRACELYRTCFAGNHLQIPQVTADKLKTLITRYSRADLEAAFDAAANSGAKSLKYLEATIEGKRQNKEPTAKRRAKKGENDNGWRCKDITGHWNPEGRGERGMSRPADSRSSPWGDIGAITTEELDACVDAGLGTGRLSNAPIQPGAG